MALKNITFKFDLKLELIKDQEIERNLKLIDGKIEDNLRDFMRQWGYSRWFKKDGKLAKYAKINFESMCRNANLKCENYFLDLEQKKFLDFYLKKYNSKIQNLCNKKQQSFVFSKNLPKINIKIKENHFIGIKDNKLALFVKSKNWGLTGFEKYKYLNYARRSKKGKLIGQTQIGFIFIQYNKNI